jgi:hypothetical protein
LLTGLNSTHLPIVSKCVGGVGGSLISKNHHSLKGVHSKLHSLQTMKVKIKGGFANQNMPHSQQKSGLFFSSTNMPAPWSLEEISKKIDLLVLKQSYVLRLKEQINGIQINLV